MGNQFQLVIIIYKKMLGSLGKQVFKTGDVSKIHEIIAQVFEPQPKNLLRWDTPESSLQPSQAAKQ
jgi:hypothetical protein